MGKVVGLSFVAAGNPTLLAATTVMLLLPRPEWLRLGYWLGAMLIGVTLGVVIVFVLEGSNFDAGGEENGPPGDCTRVGGDPVGRRRCARHRP